MNKLELIRHRRSVRTFDGNPLRPEKSKGYVDAAGWDLQKVDLGIALYHFAYDFDEKVQMSINAPGLSVPDDVEYIATLIAD